MSRIHEALKMAEQERAANHSAEVLTEQHDLKKTIEPSAAAKLIQPLSAVPEQEVGDPPGPLQFEEFKANCTKPHWNPERNLLVFCNPNPFPVGTEQFRTLRSRLYRVRESQPLRRILISSSIPMEGKTTVAANLAYTFVRQHGCRTLLIDGDLRNPNLHKILGAPTTPGLAEYLQGEASETDIVQAGPDEGLFFIPAGRLVTHPAELIANGRMQQLLDRLGPMFDWVILDSPPALPVSDASVIARMCDGVLLVVRAMSTQSELAQKACQELKDSHVIGVVLNCSESGTKYGEYYGSGSYGKEIPSSLNA